VLIVRSPGINPTFYLINLARPREEFKGIHLLTTCTFIELALVFACA
jgi:hypothetical protein